MPNPFTFLRQQNLFDPNQIIPPPNYMGDINFGNTTLPSPGPISSLPQANPDQPGMYDVAKRMAELYQPDTTSSDRFNQLLNQYPQDTGHSRLARLGAGLIAGVVGMDNPIAGIQTGKNLLDAKHQGDIEEWKNQIQPVEQAANIERQTNANQRTSAYQTIQQEIKQQADDAKAKNDAAKLKVSQDRAAVYAFKSQNPNLKLIIPKGGNIQSFNPVTGETKDTGIDSGSLSDTDKISFQNEGAIAKIDETGKQNRQTEGMKETNQNQLAETRGWKVGTIPDPSDPSKSIGVRYNEITGEVQPVKFGGQNVTSVTAPSKSGGKGTELPTQARVRQFNAARELYNSRPDLQKFIKLGTPGSNDFEITAPSEGFFGHSGPNDSQYQEIKNAIYGGGPSLLTSHTPPNQPNSTKQTIMPPDLDKMTNPHDKAVAILRANNKLVNEQTIALVMKQLGGQ